MTHSTERQASVGESINSIFYIISCTICGKGSVLFNLVSWTYKRLYPCSSLVFVKYTHERGEKFVGEKWQNFYFLTKHLTDEIF